MRILGAVTGPHQANRRGCRGTQRSLPLINVMEECRQGEHPDSHIVMLKKTIDTIHPNGPQIRIGTFLHRTALTLLRKRS